MNKTILITGSSSGIGKASAQYFQARGWNVIATMRSPHAEVDLCSLDRVLVTRLDVEEEASVHQAVAAGLERFGGIDVLLNNAGYGAYGPLEATSIQKIRRQFEVNVVGPLIVTKALLPHFRARRAGVLVNVSSIGGRMAFPLGSLYHGSKFAIEGVSEALTFEMNAIGVRVKLVEPGMVRTDFAGRSFDLNVDPSLTEYGPIVANVLSAFEPMAAAASSPELVAEVIYAAATDGSGQLRYTAGADAAEAVQTRKSLEDGPFLARTSQIFGL